MILSKLRQVLILGSLLFLVVFVYQIIYLLQSDLYNLSNILSIRQLLLKLEWGLYCFYLAFFVLVISGVLYCGPFWWLTIVSYGSLMYILKDIFSQIHNTNQLFSCSMYFTTSCIGLSTQFQKLDFNLLNVNYYLIAVSIIGIIVGSLRLLQYIDLD